MSGSPAKSRPPPKESMTSANGITVAAPFSPSDSTDLPGGPCLGFSVVTAGTYVVTFTDDANGTNSPVACAVGFNRYSVKRIWSTGSVATTGITPLY